MLPGTAAILLQPDHRLNTTPVTEQPQSSGPAAMESRSSPTTSGAESHHLLPGAAATLLQPDCRLNTTSQVDGHQLATPQSQCICASTPSSVSWQQGSNSHPPLGVTSRICRSWLAPSGNIKCLIHDIGPLPLLLLQEPRGRQAVAGVGWEDHNRPHRPRAGCGHQLRHIAVISNLGGCCEDDVVHTEDVGEHTLSTLHTSECESDVAEYLAVEQQKDPRVRELKEFLKQGTSNLPTDPARA